MKVNMEILNAIHAVRDYKRFIQSYHKMLLQDCNFDQYTEAEKFFYNLSITGGLPKNKACFEAIIRYPQNLLDQLDKVESHNLHNYEFGF